MTWTFILDILCFFCFVSICGVGCGQLGLYATSQNIVKMHVLCPIISFRFSVFFQPRRVRLHPNASERVRKLRKLPKASKNFRRLLKTSRKFHKQLANFRKRFVFFLQTPVSSTVFSSVSCVVILHKATGMKCTGPLNQDFIGKLSDGH